MLRKGIEMDRVEEMREEMRYDDLDRLLTVHTGEMCDFEDAPDDSDLVLDVA